MPTYAIAPETEAQVRAQWPDILRDLAAGKLIKLICRDRGITNEVLRNYRMLVPHAQAEWDAAREESADGLFDEALDTARHPQQIMIHPDTREPIIDPETGKPYIIQMSPAHTRNLLDTLKWAARLRNPRLYGDRSTLDVNVTQLDLTAIMAQANARLANARRPLTIEGESRRVESSEAQIASGIKEIAGGTGGGGS